MRNSVMAARNSKLWFRRNAYPFYIVNFVSNRYSYYEQYASDIVILTKNRVELWLKI